MKVCERSSRNLFSSSWLSWLVRWLAFHLAFVVNGGLVGQTKQPSEEVESEWFGAAVVMGMVCGCVKVGLGH